MRILSACKRCIPLLVLACLPGLLTVPLIRAQASAQTSILTPADVAKMMPATVFFRGQIASVQIRNTYGVRFPGGALVLAGLVDSSGYSSGLKTKYQGYLLSELPLVIDGKTLLAGAYGFGFLAKNDFVVMDLGGHDLLRVASQTDAALKRPRPLRIAPGKDSGTFRLYEGRSFVSLRRK
ncbi:MAG: hypothetical protein WA708_02030 [Acidobacteriaceae bacterium]